MANFEVTITGNTSLDWQLRLSEWFDTDSYISAGFATEPVSNGQDYPPNNIIDSIIAQASAYLPPEIVFYVIYGDVSGLTAGETYTFYPYAQAANGLYYIADPSQTLTMPGGGTRPLSWAWQSNIAIGEYINISASEWGDFSDRIDEFRDYKNLFPYGFTPISSGGSWYSYLANQAVNAINDMSPPTSVPSQVSTSDKMYASFFNGLKDSLNSIT